MTIDQIIERELLGARAVSIPFVGTLGVERISAHFVSGVGSPIVPPCGVLTLSPDYIDECSIISILADELCGADMDQATLLYNDWLAISSGVDQMVIDGVCAVDLNQFTIVPDDRFSDLLSPAGVAPVSIGRTTPLGQEQPRRVRNPRGRQSNVPITIALLAVILAAIYIVYYLFFRN